MLETVAPDCLRVYDVNLRQKYYSTNILEESFRRAQLVKLNEEEAVCVAKMFGFNGDRIPFCAWLCRTFGVEKVCVTRGEQGCLIVEDAPTDVGLQVAEAVSAPVRVADTVGSGDAFTAALIYAILHRFSLQDQATFANAVGALVAGKEGGMPVLKKELADLLKND